MLGLLRKYQKVIFAFVAVIIFVSFSFFGTYSSFAGQKKAPDRTIGHLLGGGKLKESELRGMVRFLATDRQDYELMQQGGYPNLLNDGVLRNDFLATGLYKELSKYYFDEMREDIEVRIGKAKRFTPYAHPQAPVISARTIWGQFMPNLSAHLDAVQSYEGDVDEKALDHLVDLYIDETQFPSHILRQVLTMQERENKWLPHDGALDRVDLSLFSNHTLTDWFGPKFVELSAQVILNGAAFAREQGYEVSYGEARADLIQSAFTVLKARLNKDEVSGEEMGSFLQNQFAAIGLSEQGTVKVWRDVLLFRTLLSDPSRATFLDPLMYADFHRFASDQITLAHYTVPSDFNFETLCDVGELALYFEALGGKEGALTPPESVKEGGIPDELRRTQYKVRMASVNRNQIAMNLSVQQTLQWQVQDDHWEALRVKFEPLASVLAKGDEERIQALDALSQVERDRVDHLSRRLMVTAYPEWITEALEKAPLSDATIAIPFKGPSHSIVGLTDGKALCQQLTAAIAQDPIIYSGDDDHFYRIEVIERMGTEGDVLTFAAAKREGVMGRLLDKRLEAAYPRVRQMEPTLFKDEKGEFKPLYLVKETVARHMLKHSLISLEEQLQAKGVKFEGSPLSQPSKFYAQHLLYPYFAKARADVIKMHERSTYLAKEGESPLLAQWKLSKETVDVLRSKPMSFLSKQAFDMKENEWSKVTFDDQGHPNFFQVLAKVAGSAESSEAMKRGQELVALEARAHVLDHLLSAMSEGEVVTFLNEGGDGA